MRFDIVNGPLTSIVWITTDAGADMAGLHPNERGTIYAPFFEGIHIEVFGDGGCNLIAELDWWPDPSPSTLMLVPDATGTKYEIRIDPGVEGAPLPRSDYLFAACSG
jgi:hypothetical protein